MARASFLSPVKRESVAEDRELSIHRSLQFFYGFLWRILNLNLHLHLYKIQITQKRPYTPNWGLEQQEVDAQETSYCLVHIVVMQRHWFTFFK